MTTSTRQHDTADGPRTWVFQTNLRTAAGRLARRPVTAPSHQFGLFWRVFAVNGVILLIAFALLVLTPITVSSPTTTDQLLVLSAGLAVMLVANAALLRFSLTPLRRLADQMGTVDVLDPGERLERSGTAEVATVIEAFNTALDRLEAERRSSTRRVLFAQEAERRRIAQELHDQIGQDLTAVVLELKRVQTRVTPEEAETLADAQELARESLEDLRRISHQLRPVALDDLGLSSAIAALCADITRRTGFDIEFDGVAGTLPQIDHDTELAIYRIAQESITNAVRHSGGTRVDVTLTAEPAGLILQVVDDGCGFEAPIGGGGIRGMRERALAIGGRLTVGGGRTAAAPSPSACRRWTEPRVTGNAASPIRVLLADDHAVVRRGLRLVLESAPDLVVVAEVGDGVEAVDRAGRGDVDLAILDISMPRMGGLEAARVLREAQPDMKILMLSMHDNEQYFLEALRLGAGGYVLKSQADNDLIRACRSTMRGESFVYPQTEHLLLSHAVSAEDAADVSRLTRREAQILRADRRGAHRPRDRRAAGDQPAHRRAAPREPAGQARAAKPRRAHPLRDPRRADRAVGLGHVGQPGDHTRAAARRAGQLQPSADGVDTVGEAVQAGALAGQGAAAAVVRHLDQHDPAVHACGDRRAARLGVAHDVRQRLRDDVVGGRLDIRRQPLREPQLDLDRQGRPRRQALHRRLQPAVGEHRRMDAPRQLPQLLQAHRQLLEGGAQLRPPRRPGHGGAGRASSAAPATATRSAAAPRRGGSARAAAGPRRRPP